jgi:hypothetical protein
MDDKNQPPASDVSTHIDPDFALGVRYGLLLVEVESLRQQLELAINSGDLKTANEIAPKLSAANKAVWEAHLLIMSKLQPIVNAMCTERTN